MKKTLIILLSIILTVGLCTGCTKNDPEPTPQANTLTASEVATLIEGLDSTISSLGLKGDYNIKSQKVDGNKNDIVVEYNGSKDSLVYNAEYKITVVTNAEGKTSISSYSKESTSTTLKEQTLDEILKLLNIDTNGMTGKYELVESKVDGEIQNVKVKFISDDGDYESVYTTSIVLKDGVATSSGKIETEIIKDETNKIIATPITLEKVLDLIKGKDTKVDEIPYIESAYNIISQSIDGAVNDIVVSFIGKGHINNYEAEYKVGTITNENGDVMLTSFDVTKSEKKAFDVAPITLEKVLELIKGKDSKVNAIPYTDSAYSIVSQTVSGAVNNIIVSFIGKGYINNYEAEYKVEATTNEKGEINLTSFNVTKSENKAFDVLLNDDEIIALIKGKDSYQSIYPGKLEVYNKLANGNQTEAIFQYHGENDKAKYEAMYFLHASKDVNNVNHLDDFTVKSATTTMKEITPEDVLNLTKIDMNGLPGKWSMKSQKVTGTLDEFVMEFASDDGKYIVDYSGNIVLNNDHYELLTLDVNIIKNETTTPEGAPESDPTVYIDQVEKYYMSKGYEKVTVNKIEAKDGKVYATIEATDIFKYINDVSTIDCVFTAKDKTISYVSETVKKVETWSNFDNIFYNVDNTLVPLTYQSYIILHPDWTYEFYENNFSGFSVVKGYYSISYSTLTIKNKGLKFGAYNEQTTYTFEIVSSDTIKIKSNICTTQAGERFVVPHS